MNRTYKFSILLSLLSIVNLSFIMAHNSMLMYTVEMFTKYRLLSNILLRGIVYITHGLLPMVFLCSVLMIFIKSGRNKYVLFSIFLSVISIYIVYFQTGITFIIY
jgi:hypothetical protein